MHSLRGLGEGRCSDTDGWKHKTKGCFPGWQAARRENNEYAHHVPSTILGTKNAEVKGRKYPCRYGTYSLMRNKYALRGPILGHNGLKQQELRM